MCFEKVCAHKHRIMNGSLVCKVYTNLTLVSGLGAFDAKKINFEPNQLKMIYSLFLTSKAPIRYFTVVAPSEIDSDLISPE